MIALTILIQGLLGVKMELDPSTPNIPTAIQTGREFVESAGSINTGFMTVTTVTDSFEVIFPDLPVTQTSTYSPAGTSLHDYTETEDSTLAQTTDAIASAWTTTNSYDNTSSTRGTDSTEANATVTTQKYGFDNTTNTNSTTAEIDSTEATIIYTKTQETTSRVTEQTGNITVTTRVLGNDTTTNATQTYINETETTKVTTIQQNNTESTENTANTTLATIEHDSGATINTTYHIQTTQEEQITGSTIIAKDTTATDGHSNASTINATEFTSTKQDNASESTTKSMDTTLTTTKDDHTGSTTEIDDTELTTKTSDIEVTTSDTAKASAAEATTLTTDDVTTVQATDSDSTLTTQTEDTSETTKEDDTVTSQQLTTNTTISLTTEPDSTGNAVTFMFELDYDNISGVIVAGIKSQLPFMIGFDGGSVNITVFNKNDKIGVEFALISTTPDIDDIMLQTKSFVTCGTVLIVPGGPDILAVDDSFEVEYPSDMEPVLTGNEEITCPGEESGSSMHAMKVSVITLAVTMSILSDYRF